MTVPISEQVRCARRELAMRRNVYPKWVQSGRMKQQDADREVVGMEAIVATLEGLAGSSTSTAAAGEVGAGDA